jgi:hypothetical protein
MESTAYGTHSLRRTKAAQIYRKTGNLRAVQLDTSKYCVFLGAMVSEGRGAATAPGSEPISAARTAFRGVERSFGLLRPRRFGLTARRRASCCRSDWRARSSLWLGRGRLFE